MREKQALMTYALAGQGRRKVRDDDEDVLDIVHDNQSTSTPHIPSATVRLCQRAAWHTVLENEPCLFHVQPVRGVHQRTCISVHSFLDDCDASICTPLNLCAVAIYEGKGLCHGSSSLRRSNVPHSGDCFRHVSWTTISRQGLNLTSL
jgi:hypothetical protein